MKQLISKIRAAILTTMVMVVGIVMRIKTQEAQIDRGCRDGMEEVDDGGKTNTGGMLIQPGNGMRGSTFNVNDSSIFDHIIDVVFSVKQPGWFRDC
jgi:hypothetical protein